ncbi:hypothetical protein H9P43_002140 [Blastocladiella emersonii ATCC 22665]|nr:hypothetical protein H9P43_002140 [Blastocladiella emersonii ATCC 22665]
MTAAVPTAILSVTVIQGRGMPRMDFMGGNDSFVKVSIDKSPAECEELAAKQAKEMKSDDEAVAKAATDAPPVLYARTQVSDDHDPVWNEAFPMPIYSATGPRVLYVEVYDEDTGNKDDLIGTAVVDIPRFLLADEAEDKDNPNKAPETRLAEKQRAAVHWVKLSNAQGGPAGELQLMIHMLPKSAIQRMSEKVNNSVDALKNALMAKVVHIATDIACGQVKSYFK